MQDRFKYRCWHKPTKTMYEVFEFNKTFIKATPSFVVTSIRTIKTEDCILIQCTGLKDKNGKLIYEGNIVRESFGETGTYRVEYFPYSAEWQYVNLDDEKPNWEMFSIQFEGMSENQGISTDLEIIGNIYENPELIGGAEC